MGVFRRCASYATSETAALQDAWQAADGGRRLQLLALVTLDEARRLDCEVTGQHGNLVRFLIGPWPLPSLAIWRGPVRDAPADLVAVRVVEREDKEFMEARRAKYDAPWPLCRLAGKAAPDTHPELRRLDELYLARSEEWELAKQARLQAAGLHPSIRYIPYGTHCPHCEAEIVV